MNAQDPKPGWNASAPKSNMNWRALLLIVGAIIVVYIVSQQQGASSLGGGGGNGGGRAAEYVADYGGAIGVYQQILADTSCNSLQTTFDRAAGNNDTAEPGTAEHKWTTGYMVAVDTRMQALGCY